MPVDPVCGIELDEEIALVHEHKGAKYYFCCNGCMKIFAKRPRKWSRRA
ncbi:MAG: YHS domain-containing protein [Thaumarchaeota archaeon]|nr:YHS domain-containing protein [Nitrososphaerota archaeon]RNJ74729.1 MAG: YHS domain-containing protein [Thaumarchaeota archaeon S13]MDD9810073.1 YHS domain-containing protein [Nitrososphaerota archaeon]MDD9813317.1 YHS domain-containing protein [Nitrososphaerota archaeon]MDD9826391.1 YHS domain-containing protein [Nitrososphaerota archaeon]